MIKEIESTLLTQKLDLPLTSSITVMMFFATILSISCYSVIAPFLPSEFDRRNIDEVIVGLIFAVFSLAVIFGSPIMGYII
jgi:MFS family permease